MDSMTEQADIRNDGHALRTGLLGGAPPPASPWTRFVRFVLRVPLVAKIAGANALIVVATLGAAFGWGATGPSEMRFIVILGAALAGSLIANVVLVVVALRPLNDLEATAQRIWSGNLDARVPISPLADAVLLRIGSALNVLLDGLTADRARMRALASQVISAGDKERAYIARELHDSTAQTLAALLLELSVIAKENSNPVVADRLERVRRISGDVLDEVKLLAHTVHPRVLDDLGLTAALRLLAREAEERGRVTVQVQVDEATNAVPPAQQSVLYRVGQEAVNNALRHARPEVISLRLSLQGETARLEVEDDGAGFEISEAERRRAGMGLFTMRERAALVGGALQITSHPGRGTLVVATVPTSPGSMPATPSGASG